MLEKVGVTPLARGLGVGGRLPRLAEEPQPGSRRVFFTKAPA